MLRRCDDLKRDKEMLSGRHRQREGFNLQRLSKRFVPGLENEIRNPTCYLCHVQTANLFAFTVEVHDRVQMVMFIAPAGIVRLKPS